MVGYLSDTDYLSQIKSDVLSLITNSNGDLRTRAEHSAITELESYLSGRFDTALIFLRFNIWDNAVNYVVDEQVVFENAVWKSLSINSGQEPAEGSEHWVKVFQRNELITTFLIDIVLYHLNARIAFDQVSTIRMDRYNRAVTWLKDVASGKINPNLPVLDRDEDGVADNTYFKWSSRSKFNSKGSYF